MEIPVKLRPNLISVLEFGAHLIFKKIRYRSATPCLNLRTCTFLLLQTKQRQLNSSFSSNNVVYIDRCSVAVVFSRGTCVVQIR